ncbi:MAG: RdgB/HAM1 family non-canonical purine NTP pyrophosphatase [Bacteroidales bacterium]|nr:RdgB/HAM1 family non-canonical purine NTP pyrophosphatase [Candidatus Latescibacterota bacterium]
MGLKIVLATRNQGKIREIREILAGTGIETVTLDDYDSFDEPEETGSTFTENAMIKAKATFEVTGLPSLADDSGLEVDALDGGPGIRSARYGGEGLNDIDRCRRLLSELEGVAAEGRKARFRCAMVLYPVPSTGEGAFVTEGVLDGIIAREPAGENGFGYDPVFYIEEMKGTAAEIGPEKKNSISHRYRALIEMKSLLTGGSGIVKSENIE